MEAQVYIGEVKKTDYKKGTVKVYFEEIDDTIDDIAVLHGFTDSTCLPNKGATVLVIFENNRLAKGYAIAEYYSTQGTEPEETPTAEKWQATVGSPTIKGENIVIDAKTITLKADKLNLNGTTTDIHAASSNVHKYC